MDYKKLFKDKKNGKLSDNMVIIMDNDGGSWMCTDEKLSENDHEEKENEYNKTYGTPDGYCDIIKVLNAAGINAEWC